MIKRKHVLSFLVTVVLLSACVSAPPGPDPLKEELTVLQKQLLEVQKTSNENKQKLDEANTTIRETRQKLDDANSTINTLNTKVKYLEEKQAAKPAPSIAAQKKPEPVKKKPAKKVKKKKKKPARSE